MGLNNSNNQEGGKSPDELVKMENWRVLKAQKGPGKALKEAIPCPATP